MALHKLALKTFPKLLADKRAGPNDCVPRGIGPSSSFKEISLFLESVGLSTACVVCLDEKLGVLILISIETAN